MQTTPRVSDDEYLQRERAAETEHELVDGHIVAMARASYRHNAVVANILASLAGQLRGKGCRPLASEQRVHVPATGLYTYPDISVVCGEPSFDPKDAMTITNPKVIIEVLSQGTEAFDRGAKFAHYPRDSVLPDVRDDRPARRARGALRARRRRGVDFHESTGLSSRLELGAVGASISLADIYADLPPLD